MSYIALYRKWRPLVFDDITGQEHIITTLKNGVVSRRITHAYLFTGAHGTGKTTTAKVLARAVNCLSPNNGNPCNECDVCKGILSGSLLDVIEIDAASNNGVDNIREIRDEANYCPSKAEYKVYIVDEVHMLSGGAFNALLKTLEEPPSHVIFILATTEPHKLPATILSRCQRYDFRRVPVEDVVKRIKFISDEIGVQIYDDAADLIARLSEGSMRDAISLLDQVSMLDRNNITYDDVLYVAGIVHDETISNIVDSIHACEINNVLKLIDGVSSEGKSMVQFVSDIMAYFRNLLVLCITEGKTELITSNKKTLEIMRKQSKLYDKDTLILIINDLSATLYEIKRAERSKVLTEVALLKLCMMFQKKQYIEKDRNNTDEQKTKPKKAKVVQKDLTQENEPVSIEVMEQQENENTVSSTLEKADAQSGHNQSNNKSFDNWDEVMQALKAKGKVGLYHSLKDVEVRILSDRVLGILFGTDGGASKEFVSQPSNIEAIQDAVSSVTGMDMKIKCLLQKDAEQAEDVFMEKVQQFTESLGIPINMIDE